MDEHENREIKMDEHENREIKEETKEIPKEEIEKREVPKKKKTNMWKISTFVLLILLVVSVFTSGLGISLKNGDSVAQNAVGFINTNLLQGQAVATLQDVVTESGVYKATISVAGQSLPVYLTKDGDLMFLQAIPLSGEPLNSGDLTPGANGAEPAAPIDMIALEDDDPVLGDDNAPVTIIEFSDFQCPFCGKFYTETLPLLEENYIDTGKVRLIYRDLPLINIHPQAQSAAEAAECAHEQGKFWEYHDKLFENQQALSTDSYKQWASDLGLGTEQFNECLDSNKYESEVNQDSNDAQSIGITGTPAFVINGQLISGAQPFSVFEQIIEEELSK